MHTYFSFLSFFIFTPKQSFPLQEIPLFFRYSSIDTPSMEERWSIDGLTMEYPWSFGYIGYLCFKIFAVCFHNLLNLFGCFRKKLYICNQ